MKVRLANYTLKPVEEIYKGYRICYAQGTQDEIKIPMNETSMGDYPDIEKMSNFIIPLMSEGHTSPLEHCNLTFYVEGVSRALTHQLVRHRSGSYNQQSQRYVNLFQFEYVIPPAIEKIPEAKEIFINAMKKDQEDYDRLTMILLNDYAKKELDDSILIPQITEMEYPYAVTLEDVDKKTYNKLMKKAMEDARYVFPNACCSNITMTIDLHNFRNFYGQRDCVGAQWEIQELAKEMMKQVKEVVPFADVNAKRCKRICNSCFK